MIKNTSTRNNVKRVNVRIVLRLAAQNSISDQSRPCSKFSNRKLSAKFGAYISGFYVLCPIVNNSYGNEKSCSKMLNI